MPTTVSTWPQEIPNTMNAYNAAVEEKYRFFSYGDAMFITYNPQAINERVGE